MQSVRVCMWPCLPITLRSAEGSAPCFARALTPATCLFVGCLRGVRWCAGPTTIAGRRHDQAARVACAWVRLALSGSVSWAGGRVAVASRALRVPRGGVPERGHRGLLCVRARGGCARCVGRRDPRKGARLVSLVR